MVLMDARTIRQECARRGWSQEELARQAGLSRPTVSVAVRGGLVSARTAERIRDAFKRVKPSLDGLVRGTA